MNNQQHTKRIRPCMLMWVCVALLAFAPARSLADCQSNATYGDISRITLVRCGSAAHQPCFKASLSSDGRNTGGRLVVEKLGELRGVYYNYQFPLSVFASAVQLLQSQNFLNLNIPQPFPSQPGVALVHFDAPQYIIQVQRCSQIYGVQVGAVYLDDSAQYRRFMNLVDALTSVVTSIDWRRRSARVTVDEITDAFYR